MKLKKLLLCGDFNRMIYKLTIHVRNDIVNKTFPQIFKVPTSNFNICYYLNDFYFM